MATQTLEVVYTWPDGRQEVRYRRWAGTEEAAKLMAEVEALRKAHKDSPYSYRFVGPENSSTLPQQITSPS